MAAEDRLTRDEIATEVADLKRELESLETEWAGRAYDDESEAEYNRINERIDELAELDRQLKVREDRLRDLAGEEQVERVEQFQTRRPGAVSGTDIWDIATVRMESPEAQARDLHDRAMRALDVARFAHPDLDADHARSHVEHVMGDPEMAAYVGGNTHSQRIADRILRTGSPGYRKAFTKYLLGASRSREDDMYLERAMSLTGASGGVAVPYVLDATLLPSYNGAVNPFRNIADVRTITVDEWRGVTSGGITAAYQAEAAATTDQSPTLASVSISTEMARVNIPHSIEISMDWDGFASDMASEIQNSKDVLEATKFAVGSGTNEPSGVITGATTLFTSSDSAAIYVADIQGVHDALPPLYRSRGVWALANATLTRIRNLDTAGGSNMLTPSLQVRAGANVGSSSAPDMQDSRANVDLFGRPVHEASGVATFADNALIAVIGAFNPYFKIIDRVGMSIVDAGYAQDATTGFPTGQKLLFAYWRNGSKVVAANAFRTLRVA